MANRIAKPTISVIIPTFNEEVQIAHCISSIMRCNYPKNDVEIIIVDNGSKDNTVNIARSFNIKVMIDENKTIGGLRNLGCKIAKGDIYGFLDADCTVDEDWLINAENVLSDKAIGVTGTSLKVPVHGNWIEKSWAVHLLSINKNQGDVKYINSANCFLRKEAFREVGGFSEVLKTSEDTDICERINALGYRIYNCSKISATHWRFPKTIKGFLKREIWHGLGAIKKNISSFWRSKALLFSVYNIIVFLVVFPLSVINYRALLIPLLFFFIPPLFLASINSIKANKIKYFFNLFVLYSLYGIARAISFIIIGKEYLEMNKRKVSP